MRPLSDRGTVKVYGNGEAPPLRPVETSVLERVRQSGVLRVGYFDDSLPYVFRNKRGELVGFDVEMALQFAKDLGVSAEMVRLDRGQLERGLDPSVCDVIMSGVAVTTDRSLRVQFSSAYLDETIAFIVLDDRAAAFSEWATVRAMKTLRVGVPRAPYFLKKIHEELPEAEIVPVDSMDDMFRPRNPPLDAMMASAERGSAYTLLHPEYSVAVPKPRPAKVPIAYAIAGRDSAMTAMVDTWVDLKRKDGTIDQLFAHWILGQSGGAKRPRWSIMRDVLHWIR
jgi:ABC-type amino acid transport substrate-binding protein